MRIAIVGAGYVGLVTGAGLAALGHRVTCIDVDASRVQALNSGIAPIYEPGLETLLTQGIAAGLLDFDTHYDRSIPESDVVFLAVGTPSRRGDGHADLTFIFDATRQVAQHLRGFTVVATKSTVPVGTGDEVARILYEVRPSLDVAVVSNPEFLREGAAVEDFNRPDRIIVGLDDERARGVMSEVYAPLVRQGTPLVFTDRRTAELTKYAANAFLAMKVSFINEMADLCERAGANVEEVAHGMGLDARIGAKFLKAGPGYGGSCFPKDTLALMRTGQALGAKLSLVETTIAVNDARRARMVDKIVEACGGEISGKKIGILGLTFKPSTDDLRESPATEIVQKLLEKGAEITAYDPQGLRTAVAMQPAIRPGADAYDVAKTADCLVLITDWDDFRSLDLSRIARSMRHPLLVDLRNVYSRDEAMQAGLDYVSIGRPDPNPDRTLNAF